jgi:cation:H+ antiporter
MIPWLLLLLSLAVILVGCDLFTNGIEWAGKRLNLAEGAVGSVLAAVGTCLPETFIAILAIVFGKKGGSGDAVGIGAILGAPLMLSTVAFFITGVAILYFSKRGLRTTEMPVNHKVIGRDLRFFFIVFSLAAAASWLPTRAAKIGVALALIVLYGIYVRQTFADEAEEGVHEDISPLHFSKFAKHVVDPHMLIIALQVVAGLGILVFGAHLFVDKLTQIAKTTGLNVLVLSLILTPIATELPEKFNSVLWVRRKKDTLALGNISGAMVFQSSVVPAVGMIFTNWVLNSVAIASVVIAILSSGAVWLEMTIKKRMSPYPLLIGGVFYVGYIIWMWQSGHLNS